MSNPTEPDYDHPDCFQTFHELSAQKQWEVYRKLRDAMVTISEYCMFVTQDYGYNRDVSYIRSVALSALGAENEP